MGTSRNYLKSAKDIELVVDHNFINVIGDRNVITALDKWPKRFEGDTTTRNCLTKSWLILDVCKNVKLEPTKAPALIDVTSQQISLRHDTRKSVNFDRQ